jgi:hypothetical protein
MAIKGKGKAKAGRRTVTRGPRPGYVEPPKPLVKRTWFRATAIGVLAAAVIAIVLTVVITTHDNNKKKAAAAEAHDKQGRVEQYVGPVTQYLQGVAQPLGGGAEVAAFQDLPTQLTDFKSGKLSPDDAAGIGKNVSNDAAVAATNIEKLDVPTLVDSARFPDLLDLQDSQELLAASLRMYERVGDDMQIAAKATGDTQQAIIDGDIKQVPIATTLFRDGYTKLVNQQIAVGLPPNVFPAPGPSPTPSPSPSPTASPSPSTSPSTAPSTSPSTSPKPKPTGSHKPKPTGSATGGGPETPKPTPTAS